MRGGSTFRGQSQNGQSHLTWAGVGVGLGAGAGGGVEVSEEGVAVAVESVDAIAAVLRVCCWGDCGAVLVRW